MHSDKSSDRTKQGFRFSPKICPCRFFGFFKKTLYATVCQRGRIGRVQILFVERPPGQVAYRLFVWNPQWACGRVQILYLEYRKSAEAKYSISLRAGLSGRPSAGPGVAYRFLCRTRRGWVACRLFCGIGGRACRVQISYLEILQKESVHDRIWRFFKRSLYATRIRFLYVTSPGLVFAYHSAPEAQA